MKLCNEFRFRCDDELIISKNGPLNEIRSFIEKTNRKFEKGSPSLIKEQFKKLFKHNSWAANVNLSSSRLTINYLKDKVGVCIQIGNVARTYADILKLSWMYEKGKIELAIIIVPHYLESKSLGQNYAYFDRLKNELELFENILNTPIMVICISN